MVVLISRLCEAAAEPTHACPMNQAPATGASSPWRGGCVCRKPTARRDHCAPARGSGSHSYSQRSSHFEVESCSRQGAGWWGEEESQKAMSLKAF